jgi:hypothetical protein
MKTTEMIKSIEEARTRARGARKCLKSLLRAAYSGMPDWAAPSNADGYFRCAVAGERVDHRRARAGSPGSAGGLPCELHDDLSALPAR